MSIDPSDKKKRTRISKHTEVNRSFACECGSKYLSRGALVNHQKTKHNTVNISDNTSEIQSKTVTKQKKDYRRLKIAKMSELKVQDFKKLVKRYLSAIPSAQGFENFNPVEKFPANFFESRSVYSEFLLSLERMEKIIMLNRMDKGERSVGDIIMELNGVESYKIWDVLALHCYYMAEHLNEQFYQEIVILVVGFGNMVQNHHTRDSISDLNDFGHNTDSEFVIGVKPSRLPEFANEFLMDYYIPLVTEVGILKDPKKLVFFGSEDVHIFRAFLIMYLLCKWMYVYRFTKLKLDKFK